MNERYTVASEGSASGKGFVLHALTSDITQYDSVYLQAQLLNRTLKSLFGVPTSIYPVKRISASYLNPILSSKEPILCHYCSFIPIASKLAKRSRTIFVYHNHTPLRFYWRWEPQVALLDILTRLQLRLLPRNVQWVAVSDYNKKCLLDLGFENVKTCPCIIDTKISFPVPAKTYEPSVIFVGRIAPNKNCIELLRLVHNAASHFKRRIKLIIVGRTKKASFFGIAFRHALSQYASQYLEIDWIRRNVSSEELSSLYARSWIYVSASLHEGFGLPACEAISCKTPALYLECGGQESVLRSWGKIGLEDIDQFSYALENLLGDACERSILLTKQEEQVAQFDFQKVKGIAQLVYGSLFDRQEAH